MTYRPVRPTLDSIKAMANEIMNDNDPELGYAEEIKRLSALVPISLTREQVAFVMAVTNVAPEELSDADWERLLRLRYTSSDEEVANLAWTMVGFDGTDEEWNTVIAYRDAYANVHDGEAPNLSFNTMFAILADPENQKQYTTTEEWITAFEEAEEEEEADKVEEQSSAEDIEQLVQSADKVAETLSKDESFLNELSHTAEVEVYLKVARLVLMEKLETALGGEMIMAMPVPNSKHEKYLARVGNTFYDKYKEGGKGRKVTSYYERVLDNLPEGKLINKELQLLVQGNSVKDNVGSGPYANGQPVAGTKEGKWTSGLRQSRITTLREKYKTELKYLKDAFKLFRQLEWLQRYPAIQVEIQKDDNGVLINTTTPFLIAAKRKSGMLAPAEAYSIGAIMQFKEEQAIAGMGGHPANSFLSLMETAKRIEAPPTPAANGSSGQPAPTKPLDAQGIDVKASPTVAQAESMLFALANLWNEMSNEEPDKAPKSKAFRTTLANSDDFATAMYSVLRLTEHFRTTIEKRNREIEARNIQDRKNKADAEAAAFAKEGKTGTNG